MLNFNSFMQNQKQQFINNQYRNIYSHESAHKAAGGSLAGNIVIEKNSEGIPIGGHVSIRMPVLDEENPDKTINDARIVINSALAPSDPSNQDYKVASEAKAVLAKAEEIKKKHKLDVMA